MKNQLKQNSRPQHVLDEVMRSTGQMFAMTEAQVAALRENGYEVEIPDKFKDPLKMLDELHKQKSTEINLYQEQYEQDPATLKCAARKGKQLTEETLRKMNQDRNKNK